VSQLKIDLSQAQVSYQGQPIKLRRKELHLLSCLAQHAGRILSRTEIQDLVWEAAGTSSNTIDVTIRHLRNKIDRQFNVKLIQTWRGQGYQLLVHQSP
jgi:DNA-binding response OmpR family regulator